MKHTIEINTDEIKEMIKQGIVGLAINPESGEVVKIHYNDMPNHSCCGNPCCCCHCPEEEDYIEEEEEEEIIEDVTERLTTTVTETIRQYLRLNRQQKSTLTGTFFSAEEKVRRTLVY